MTHRSDWPEGNLREWVISLTLPSSIIDSNTLTCCLGSCPKGITSACLHHHTANREKNTHTQRHTLNFFDEGKVVRELFSGKEIWWQRAVFWKPDWWYRCTKNPQRWLESTPVPPQQAGGGRCGRGLKNKAVKGEEESGRWERKVAGGVFSCCIGGGFIQTVQRYRWPCASSLLQFICQVFFSDWEGQTVISGNVKQFKREKEETPFLRSKTFVASLWGWSQTSQTYCSFQTHITVVEFHRYRSHFTRLWTLGCSWWIGYFCLWDSASVVQFRNLSLSGAFGFSPVPLGSAGASLSFSQ